METLNINKTEAVKLIIEEIKIFDDQVSKFKKEEDEFQSNIYKKLSRYLDENYIDIQKDILNFNEQETINYLNANIKSNLSQDINNFILNNKKYNNLIKKYENSDLYPILKEKIIANKNTNTYSELKKYIYNNAINFCNDFLHEEIDRRIEKYLETNQRLISTHIEKIKSEPNLQKILITNHLLYSTNELAEWATDTYKKFINPKQKHKIELMFILGNVNKKLEQPISENDISNLKKSESKNSENVNLCKEGFVGVVENLKLLSKEIKGANYTIADFLSLMPMFHKDTQDHLNIAEGLYKGFDKSVIERMYSNMDTASRDLTSSNLWFYLFNDDEHKPFKPKKP